MLKIFSYSVLDPKKKLNIFTYNHLAQHVKSFQKFFIQFFLRLYSKYVKNYKISIFYTILIFPS